MVDRIISVLNSKYGIILAFVPIVNIAYLIFRLLFVQTKVDKIPLWYFAIIAVPAVVLYNILPGKWGWCVTHLIISCIAAFYMYKSRGAYMGKMAPREKMLRNFIPLAIFAALLILGNLWYAPHNDNPVDSSVVKEKTLEALDALVENDSEKWNSLIHPVYGTSVKTLSRFKTSLEFDGINFDSGYSYVNQYGTHFTPYDVEDGNAMCMEAFVYVGGKRCFIKTVWQCSDSGSGFVRFTLVEK